MCTPKDTDEGQPWEMVCRQVQGHTFVVCSSHTEATALGSATAFCWLVMWEGDALLPKELCAKDTMKDHFQDVFLSECVMSPPCQTCIFNNGLACIEGWACAVPRASYLGVHSPHLLSLLLSLLLLPSFSSSMPSSRKIMIWHCFAQCVVIWVC